MHMILRLPERHLITADKAEEYDLRCMRYDIRFLYRFLLKLINILLLRNTSFYGKFSRILFIPFLFLNPAFSISAQTDTSYLRVSLLTCTPGEDLYSTFGHSALRVTDSVSNADIVYNYGTFDFSE